MVKKKKNSYLFLKILLVFFIIFFFYSSLFAYYNFDFDFIKNKGERFSVDRDNVESLYYSYVGVSSNVLENTSVEPKIVFCPSQNCVDSLINYFNSAENEIKCALYEFDREDLADVLVKKSKEGVKISILIDDDYLNEDGLNLLKKTDINIFSDKYRNTRYNNFMHNKFCVVDGVSVMIGSANPTENGLMKNNNDMIFFNSKYVSKNLLFEFKQLRSGVFGTEKKSVLRYKNITLNVFENSSDITETYLINNYFCPQDDCVSKIIRILDKAEKRVIFASFAFTNDELRDKLIELNSRGVEVMGIMEKRNVNTKGGDFDYLIDNGINVVVDSNKNNMHHKFFIVDDDIVITGSMNPTKAGDKYNDENIFVVENNKLALEYINHFYSITTE